MNCFEELKASGKLPSPQGIALEIMRVTQSPTASVRQVASVVRLDPALTGRLIQLANSAQYALHRPIAAAVDAVHLLGMHTVRQFALSLSIIGANKTGACASFDYAQFWSTSLARALAAQALAVSDCTVAPEEAFTTALLANIGQLALVAVYPKQYEECLSRASADDSDTLVGIEQELFAIDQRTVTLELIRDWGFPAILVDAVAIRHEPVDSSAALNSRTERLGAQLGLATLLSRYLMTGAQDRDGLLDGIMPTAQALALDRADLDEIRGTIEKQWRWYGNLLQIPERELLPPTTVAAETNRSHAAAASPPPGPNILLIDTDISRLAQLKALLQSSGYALCSAPPGQDGLRAFLQEKPCLIIVEQHHAETEGIRFCEQLRSLQIGRDVYLMLLTSVNSEDEWVHAYAAGFNDVAVTPLNDRVLLARIANGLRMVQLQQENAREREKARQQISALAIAKRKLETLAMTDPLTRIPNRRYAFARLREEWSAWGRTGRPLSVMIVDLDHFKQVNDTFGHQAGDRLLAHIASIIRVHLRGADVVCRLGGEEFIVIAPGADEAVSYALAERLRQMVETCPLDVGEVGTKVTASIGVATSNPRIANPADLVHLADLALYDAKLSGRNCVKSSA